MGRRHRLAKKLARASRTSTSEGGVSIKNGALAGYTDEYMQTIKDSEMLKIFKGPGDGLEKLEKKAKMTKSRKKRFEKLLASQVAKQERKDLIKKLESKKTEIPDNILTSSKLLGEKSFQRRNKEHKNKKSTCMDVDV